MKICMNCNQRFKQINWVCPSCRYSPDQENGFYSFITENKDKPKFPEDSFKHLFDHESSNFWFCSRNRLIIWAVNKYFPNALNMLEIGCGTGFVLAGLKNAYPYLSLTGSDIYSTALCYAAERLKPSEIIQLDARLIPFEKEFDIIGAFDVLEHIEKDETVLQQMHQAIADEGGIILTVPQHSILWSNTDVRACHIRRYNAKDLKEKVERAGFRIVRMTSFVSLLFPLMFISRLFKRKKNLKTGPELRFNRLLNIFLEIILIFERALITFGINMPFGGSLLIIAGRMN